VQQTGPFFQSLLISRSVTLAFEPAAVPRPPKQFHVAAWIEDFPGSKPTVKLKLAAVRMLFDFLVVHTMRTCIRLDSKKLSEHLR
jgi:hypothetical protein